MSYDHYSLNKYVVCGIECVEFDMLYVVCSNMNKARATKEGHVEDSCHRKIVPRRVFRFRKHLYGIRIENSVSFFTDQIWNGASGGSSKANAECVDLIGRGGSHDGPSRVSVALDAGLVNLKRHRDYEQGVGTLLGVD